MEQLPLFYCALILFEFLAAKSVIFAVDIETIIGTYVLEDDFAALETVKLSLPAVSTRFLLEAAARQSSPQSARSLRRSASR